MVCFEPKQCKPEPKCCNQNCNQGRECSKRVIDVSFKEVKKPSAWARTPTIYKAAILAALWFLFVYLPSLGLK